ncbi:MAG: ribonuclease HII [Verrucomicrobia bacterium]|nr:ribonuclease HII [Verrucomicrobiota bacterium]
MSRQQRRKSRSRQSGVSLLKFERQCWDRGIGRLAGVDEAGRGPLAGPVMAAAVVMDRVFAEKEETGLLNGLTDSKQLTELRRDRFFAILTSNSSVLYSVGSASVEEIDSVNILNATHLAMARAIQGLPAVPEHVLIDGLPVPGLSVSSTAIVRGDGQSLLIAAASVVAKVTRDRLMKELEVQYPGYGFAKHKGYGSAMHVRALLEYGPCEAHRRSFRPVREALGIRSRSAAPDDGG